MDNSTKIRVTLDSLKFNTADYTFFVGMLVVSTAIGIYFGVYKKQKTLSEYLLGGKNMKVFPVAISLAASYTSALTILGLPAEIYDYGTQYMISCLTGFGAAFIIAKIYLPVFYELKLNSSFEYLSLRFGKNVRLITSVISIIGFILNIPIVIYVPTMALKIVSDINMIYIIPSVCAVCIFYTTVGGLKAVIWTDTIQFLIMNGSILLIIIIGITNEGGVSKIWGIAEDSGRINFFDFEWSLYKRATFWSMLFGVGIGSVASLGISEVCVQRFLSLPTLADAEKSLFIYCGFLAFIKALCLFSGLIMYARYHDCDPVSTGILSKSDEILPYYVMDTARNIPGLPGLFIAGVFSASLSTASTLLNTASSVIFRDFLKPRLPLDISEKKSQYIVQALSVIVGCICTILVFWVETLGQLLELTLSFNGMNAGAILGIFTVGMLWPRANPISVLFGSLISVVFSSWMVFGNKIVKIRYPKKSFSIENCAGNLTLQNKYYPSDIEEIFPLYKISFIWYFAIGFAVMVIFTIPISYMTSPPSLENTKYKFFSPVVRKYLPLEILENDDDDDDDDVDKNAILLDTKIKILTEIDKSTIPLKN